MTKGRVEAFSDGVLAIVITVMVLEMKVPHGADWASLQPVLPVFLSYVLSFVYVGIYWNNHHHMFHAVKHVDGPVFWANLHLLFWLSLMPFTTGWMGENHFASLPVALYGVDLLMAAIAYFFLLARTVAPPSRRNRLCQSHWQRPEGQDLARALPGRDSARLRLALAFHRRLYRSSHHLAHARPPLRARAHRALTGLNRPICRETPRYRSTCMSATASKSLSTGQSHQASASRRSATAGEKRSLIFACRTSGHDRIGSHVPCRRPHWRR